MVLLGTILDPDETYMMKVLLKDVQLSVRKGKEFGKKITKNTGVPHGDCINPILFTLYLADALKTERSTITEEHNYSKIPMNSEDLLQDNLKDHTYNLPKENGLLIDQQYADDTGWVAALVLWDTSIWIIMLLSYVNDCVKPSRKCRSSPHQRPRNRSDSDTMIERLIPFHWNPATWSG